MGRSRPLNIWSRNLVPKWLRPFSAPMALVTFIAIATWCWVQSISQWLDGLGLFGIDLILAAGFSIAAIDRAMRLPSWYREQRLRRAQGRAEAMLAAEREGKCARCGYDLTGLTSMKCPECGGWIGRRDIMS